MLHRSVIISLNHY